MSIDCLQVEIRGEELDLQHGLGQQVLESCHLPRIEVSVR